MLSANAHDFQTVDREGALHDGFLMKPFELQRLLSHLQSLCALEWIYEAPGSPVSEERLSAGSPGLPAGATRHIEELIHLGEIGYVRGIHVKLSELEDEDMTYSNLVGQARRYALNFQFDDYVRFLKGITSDG
jgi:hypothetical protein